MKYKYTPSRIVAPIAAVALLALGSLLLAGSLTPPAGPVAPTFKTLTEVEPRIAINATNTPGDADSVFRIAQSGSYYLTTNVTGTSGKSGSEVASDHVTIDLNGYFVRGFGGTLSGIRTSAAITNFTLRNGVITGWGQTGVDITVGAIGGAALFENVHFHSNGADGLRTTPSAVVRDCTAIGNAGFEFVLNDASTTSNCTTWFNSGGGISATFGCTITGCTAFANTGRGISAGDGCVISNCAVYSNFGDGIRVVNECLVTGNTCKNSRAGATDGANIHVVSTKNRIEGNNCTFADRGIDVDVPGNFIARNTCSGNTTNWDIAAGNFCLVVAAVPSGAISGDAGGVSPGSTDPNANFTH